MRNLMTAVKEAGYFCRFSTMYSQELQEIINNCSQNNGNENLFDVSPTKWVNRSNS